MRLCDKIPLAVYDESLFEEVLEINRKIKKSFIITDFDLNQVYLYGIQILDVNAFDLEGIPAGLRVTVFKFKRSGWVSRDKRSILKFNIAVVFPCKNPRSILSKNCTYYPFIINTS